MSTRQIIGLDPTGTPAAIDEVRTLAPRVATLDGVNIGIIANGLGNGESFLRYLADELRGADGTGELLITKKDSVSVPPNPGDWSRITEGAAVAITGFGG